MTLPVPSPRTWSAGDLIGGVILNTELRDAANFLANRPLFIAHQTVGQSIPTSTWTQLTFTTEEIDTYNGHDNVTNNSRYTAQVAGWYYALGVVAFPTNVTGRRVAQLSVNGIQQRQSEFADTTAAGALMVYPVEGRVYMNFNDYLEVGAWQSSGGALSTNVSAAWLSSMLCALWIHN